MRYFTADTHFNHALVARIRGFTTKEAHDEYLISMWNTYVKKGDEVYHLGDFSFGDQPTTRSIRHKLKGKIHLILGNHDKKNRIQNLTDLFTSIHSIKEISIDGTSVTLCHYAMRTWNKSHFDAWQLYGHSHGGLAPIGKQHDVGLDGNNIRLVSEAEVISIMKDKPHNENYLRHHR